MNEREQNLLIAANEIIGDFKQYGEVLQQGDNGEYGTESPIGQLSAAVEQYERAEFTCETIEQNESEGQSMTIRYEVIWCVSGHEDYHYKYFNGDTSDGQVNAFDYAKMLVTKDHTFHGCCSISEQEAERVSDKDGPFVRWETLRTWECSWETKAHGRCGFNLI